MLQKFGVFLQRHVYQGVFFFDMRYLVVFKIEIFDAWGDLYYVGLNGIELNDVEGDKIELTEKGNVYKAFLVCFTCSYRLLYVITQTFTVIKRTTRVQSKKYF